MQRNTIKNVIGAALVAALLAPAAGWAQAYGRIALWVKDTGGNALEGAQITATCEQLPKYHTETKTNKKGLAKLAFVDATKIYTVTIEKEGYVAMTIPVKAQLRTTTDQFVELQKKGQQAAPAAGSARRFTPAERVFNSGVELLKTQDLDGAKAKFLEALTIDAELAPAYSALAAIALEQKDFDGAITRANEFLALSPDHPSGYYTLYEAYKNKGDTESAEAALVRFTSLDEGGDSAILIYNEGIDALKLGQLAVAKQRFESSLFADPQLAAPLLGLAKAQLGLGEFESAAQSAEQFLVTDATHYVAQRTRYEAYTALDDTANADDAFAQLVAQHPVKVAQTLYDKGVKLFNDGDSKGAIDRLERALAANPELARANYHLGLAYINAGRASEAKLRLDQFVAMAPDDPNAGSAIEMLKYLAK